MSAVALSPSTLDEDGGPEPPPAVALLGEGVTGSLGFSREQLSCIMWVASR